MHTDNRLGPFLERQTQLVSLKQYFNAASHGVGQFVVIGAEAGMGKSRLLEELRDQLPQDVQFLWGRAFSATRTDSYSVWIDALDVHLRSLDGEMARQVLLDAPDLAGSLFSFNTAAADRASPSREVDSPHRASLFVQMASVLYRLAQLSPVVLVLDNLQWADASSIEMLHAVAHSLRDCRIMIVALYRHDDPALPHVLKDSLAALTSLGEVRTLSLAPLSRHATDILVNASVGQAWSEQSINTLYAWTQGNPLFIREYLAYTISRNGGLPFSMEGIRSTLPPSIDMLLSERLQRLDDDARRVLAIASVIEARISYALLRDVTDFDEERLLAALDRLTDLHFLSESVAGADVAYDFHKPIIQSVVYQSLGAARRRYLHRLVADELLRRPQNQVYPAQLALHLVQGCDTKHAQIALPHLIRAADAAVAVFGNPEAIELLQKAIEIATSSGADAYALFSLYLNLGESYKRLGKFDDAIQAWRMALSQSTVTPAQAALLERCIVRALWQSGRTAAALAEVKAALACRLASAGVAGLFLHQEYGLACARRGKAAEALEICEQLEHAPLSQGEPELLARLRVVRAIALGYRGDTEAALQALDEAIHGSNVLPYPGATFLACYTAGALLRYHGPLEQFENMCGQCDAIAARMHALSLVSWSQSLRVERYTYLGRCQEAHEIGLKAISVDTAINQGAILPRTLSFLAVTCRVLGDIAAAQQHLRRAQDFLNAVDGAEPRLSIAPKSCMAYIDCLDGNYQEALTRLQQTLTQLGEGATLSFYLLHPYALPLAMEMAARTGEWTLAAKLADRIRQLQHDAFTPAQGALHVFDGLQAQVNGDMTGACQSLERACAVWMQQGRYVDVLRIRLDLALLLHKRGDKSKAVEILTETRAAWLAVGAPREAALLSQHLLDIKGRAARGPQPSPALESDVPRLSAREIDVVSLLRKGMTNKEIAVKLFLSELTVETHVKNILRKLSLKSRAQVAAYAVEQNIGN